MVFIALARVPRGTWFFACPIGDRLAHGPLARAWDGGPQLRDLDVHVQGRVAELVVAAPDLLDHDDVRAELRRVPAFKAARLRIHTVTPADTCAALSLPALEDGAPPAVQDLRRALGERLPGVPFNDTEEGAALALAMLVAGAEAHRTWCGRFGSTTASAGMFSIPILAEPLAGAVFRPGDLLHEPVIAPDAASNTEPARPVQPDRFSLANAPGNTLLTVADIVALYQVSRSFVYGLKDTIPHTKFGGLRFRKSDIERHLAEIQKRPAAYTFRRRRSGISVARSRPEDEVAPGLTAADLKQRVGF